MDEQLQHYQRKLQFEIDSWDLSRNLDENSGIVVIDARSKEAFTEEHIPEAVSLPHKVMQAETTAHLDRSALYVTYCDGIGCNASTKGALKLAQLGFKVKELMGGLDWWKRDGHPTSQGAPKAAEGACSCG